MCDPRLLALWVMLLSVAGTEALRGIKHIPTPFGLMPETCVHTDVRSGSVIRQIDGGVHIAHEEGSRMLPTRPECMAWLEERLAKAQARRERSVQNATLLADGWLDNAGYYPPKQVIFFAGRYSVPQTPKASGGLLYYFIGTENFQHGINVTILQPVLTYYTDGWTFSSWNCCPSGQAHQSTPISGFGPGDVVDGIIDQSGDDWRIYSGWKDKSTVLTVADSGRDFNWIDVTLETYGAKECSQFATGPARFTNMKLVLEGNTVVAPQWSDDSGATTCNGKLSITDAYDVVIEHN